jgi:hypothetical protein
MSPRRAAQCERQTDIHGVDDMCTCWRAVSCLLAALVVSACSTPESQVKAEASSLISSPAVTLLRFDRVLQLETEAATSANVSIGDVNGDGHLDLVLAKERHWPLQDRVLLGEGRRQITGAYDLGTASDLSASARRSGGRTGRRTTPAWRT